MNKFTLEIGVNAGYDTNTNSKDIKDGISAIAELVKKAAAEVQDETGIYISAVVKGPNRTCYRTEWGCPDGGELTYTVTGAANPAFVPDMEVWKDSVVKVAEKLKSWLSQTTVSIEFSQVEFVYLKQNE